MDRLFLRTGGLSVCVQGIFPLGAFCCGRSVGTFLSVRIEHFLRGREGGEPLERALKYFSSARAGGVEEAGEFAVYVYCLVHTLHLYLSNGIIQLAGVGCFDLLNPKDFGTRYLLK